MGNEGKTNCGWFGINQTQCEARGCCYMHSHVPHVPWCFHKYLSTTTTTSTLTTSTSTTLTNSTTTTTSSTATSTTSTSITSTTSSTSSSTSSSTTPPTTNLLDKL